MAIKWFNIRSGEVRVAETEPQIAAMWASSDHSPNITQGQDFGWRLAPEVVVEMRRIANDPRRLEMIALSFKMPLEDIGEKEILTYISNKTSPKAAPVATREDYRDDYEAEVRRLEKKAAKEAEKESTSEEAQE